MNSACENCKLFHNLENKRITWYKYLSLQNVKLHKKIIDQQNTISILNNKLLEANTRYLTNTLNKYNSANSNENDSDLSKSRKVHEKHLLTKFNEEIESFQQITRKSYDDLLGQIAYLEGSLNFYRSALFEELEKSNTLKLHFEDKLKDIVTDTENKLFAQIKEEYEKLNNEFKIRYKDRITTSETELTKQVDLVKRLRNHNKKLCSVIIENKREFNAKYDSKQKELENAMKLVKNIRKKNDELYEQIKLTREHNCNYFTMSRHSSRSVKVQTNSN